MVNLLSKQKVVCHVMGHGANLLMGVIWMVVLNLGSRSWIPKFQELFFNRDERKVNELPANYI